MCKTCEMKFSDYICTEPKPKAMSILKIEKWASVVVITNESGSVIEEFQEFRNGRFPFWNANTVLRAERRLTELNK